MNVGISFADAGASYLTPCLIERDFSRRRAGMASILDQRESKEALTSSPLQTTFRSLVQKSDTQPYIDLHLLFLEVTCHPVLNNDVC